MIYEISIFDLFEINLKWKLFWEEFLLSCTFPTYQININTSLNQQEQEQEQEEEEEKLQEISTLNYSKKFLKIKNNSPCILQDTFLELYYKISHSIYKNNHITYYNNPNNTPPNTTTTNNTNTNTTMNNEWYYSNSKYCRNEGSNINLNQSINYLQQIFGNHFIQQRGNFYYPNGSYREWHTNQFDPHGWRMYIVHTLPSGTSMFRYKNPKSTGSINSKIVHNCIDYDGTVRLFNISGGDNALWHSVISEGDRWSVGFLLNDQSAEKIISLYHQINNQKQNLNP